MGVCLHGDSNTLGRRMPWAHTRNLQSFSVGFGCCADWHHPRESVPMHHKFAFWFPFHPPLSWVLCQLSFCINQREIFSPSCFSLSWTDWMSFCAAELGRGRRGQQWWKEETGLEKMLAVHQRGKTASSYKEPALHRHSDLLGKPRAL